MSNYDQIPKTNLYTLKTDFSNTEASEILVFGLYKLVLGVWT